MKSCCRLCGTRLGRLKITCPYCRQRSLSWLHVAALVALAASAALFFLRAI